MKYFFLIIIFITSISWSQEDLKNLEGVDIIGNRFGFKKVGLYDEESTKKFTIRGFSQMDIYIDELSDDFWSAKNTACLQALQGKDDLDSYLKLQWNKDQDGCDWVGMGFGWDSWAAKDIAYVQDTIAIELEVRSTGKSFTNIPCAFGIEDYAGRQAWLGYSKSFLIGKEITQNWTKVQLPFSLFPFEENQLDLTSVKQLIIQFFGEGAIEVNTIKIIPFSSKLKLDLHATSIANSPKIDGDLSDWNTSFTPLSEIHSFAVRYNPDTLFFAFSVVDDTPLQNSQKERNCWNGDAIELAFSTNSTADTKRKFFLLSDQHIGINCTSNTNAWSFNSSSEIPTILKGFKQNERGYTVEIAIPYFNLYNQKLVTGTQLGFEAAIDLGTYEKRQSQVRWNSSYEEGFNLSPAKWGILQLEK
jgi:hypothetical protein